jgi:hypothetical protein
VQSRPVNLTGRRACATGFPSNVAKKFRVRRLALSFPILLAAVGCLAADAENPGPIPDSCPVTLPMKPLPPPPQKPMEPGSAMFWYGNDALFTHISSDGRWRGIKSPTGTRNKSFWYRNPPDWHDDHPYQLLVTAHRLDAPGEWQNPGPVNNAIMGEEWAMLFMLELPSRGCWDVRANYKSDYVAFVVWAD